MKDMGEPRQRQVLTLKEGERVQIGDDMDVTVHAISSGAVQLVFIYLVEKCPIPRKSINSILYATNPDYDPNAK